MKTALIITTINRINRNILKFSNYCKKNKWDLIIIGDKKSPKNYKLKYGQFFSLKEQKKLNFNYSKICSENSYTRKNIGYLIALKKMNDVLIETDDDNFPTNKFFKKRKKIFFVREILNKEWVNIYDIFLKGKANIWPRGLPLEKIKSNKINMSKKKIKGNFLLQQGLADNNPDVDAIYRLMNEKIKIKFIDNKKISIGRAITPTNSQNTTWFKHISTLMYLPTTCSMRETDIYRGYIASNILNKLNLKTLFHSPNLIQNRNDHDLFNDYQQELPIYQNSAKILDQLQKLNFSKEKNNLAKCLIKSYKLMIKLGLIKKTELKYLEAWIKDIQKITEKIL